MRTSKLSHHMTTFTPWRFRNNQCIVASERAWKMPDDINRDAVKAFAHYSCGGGPNKPPLSRPLIRLGVDAFAAWSGLIIDRDERELMSCHGCGKWTGFMNDPCDCDEPLRARVPRKLAMADLLTRLFALIDSTPNVDYLLPTQWLDNVRGMVPHRDDRLECSQCAWRGLEEEKNRHDFDDEPGGFACPSCGEPCGHTPIDEQQFRPNLFLSTLITTQAEADAQLPKLLGCADLAGCLCVEVEPREAIDLTAIRFAREDGELGYQEFTLNALTDEAWVSHQHAGQDEGGPFHRGPAIGASIGHVIVHCDGQPSTYAFACELHDQCIAAGVAFALDNHEWNEQPRGRA
jgi:hypothetical protein